MGKRRSRHALSRRSFLRNIGQTGAGVSVGALSLPLGGCQTMPQPDATQLSNPFQHGVASGDPLTDRVIIWTRATVTSGAPCAVDWQVADDPDFKRVIARGRVDTDERRDHTVKVDVGGLQPGTTYWYRFSTLGHDSRIGRTRTAPAMGVERLRFAVMSCASMPHGFFNAYARVADRDDIDCVLHLGDYLYEYGNDGYGSKVQVGDRRYDPPHEIVTLADYRRRHAHYKRDPDLQRCHAQHPFICVWDDHEMTNDAWRDGAQNHQPATEGSWPDRAARAHRVYDEWMPIRLPEPQHHGRIYRGFSFGNLVDLTMLDTRYIGRDQQVQVKGERDANGLATFTDTGDFADPQRDLLGYDQLSFLETRLTETNATWKLLGQQVMFGQLKARGAPNATNTDNPGGQGGAFFNGDQWDGYPRARERVWDIIRGRSQCDKPVVDNVVVLTGDIHSAWSMDITEDPNNPDIDAGGYDRASGDGAMAVEFVTTSVTSPGPNADAKAEQQLRSENPHLKYVDTRRNGYLLLEVTAQYCRGEHWFVDSVKQVSTGEQLGAAHQTLAGQNRLRPVQAPSSALT